MKKLKDKRGAALVSAIAFMLVMIVLGILLTTAISYAHLQLDANKTAESVWLKKESIGEYFVQRVDKDSDSDFKTLLSDNTAYTADTEYTQSNEREQKRLILRNARETAVLYIEAEKAENVWQATCWRYSYSEP